MQVESDVHHSCDFKYENVKRDGFSNRPTFLDDREALDKFWFNRVLELLTARGHVCWINSQNQFLIHLCFAA